MGTEFSIKSFLNDFGFGCLHMFVCMYVEALSEDFCILFFARITDENKHCLYYYNEYALGNKLYNFPLTES